MFIFVQSSKVSSKLGILEASKLSGQTGGHMWRMLGLWKNQQMTQMYYAD